MKDLPMLAVLSKVSSMQELTIQDDALWAATNLAYSRCRLLRAARRAAGISDSEKWPADWSTGTTLAVALILNRDDVLRQKNYTIVEAIDRVGPVVGQFLVEIQAALKSSGQVPAPGPF